MLDGPWHEKHNENSTSIQGCVLPTWTGVRSGQMVRQRLKSVMVRTWAESGDHMALLMPASPSVIRHVHSSLLSWYTCVFEMTQGGQWGSGGGQAVVFAFARRFCRNGDLQSACICPCNHPCFLPHHRLLTSTVPLSSMAPTAYPSRGCQLHLTAPTRAQTSCCLPHQRLPLAPTTALSHLDCAPLVHGTEDQVRVLRPFQRLRQPARSSTGRLRVQPHVLRPMFRVLIQVMNAAAHPQYTQDHAHAGMRSV